jgi:hypothetical protein
MVKIVPTLTVLAMPEPPDCPKRSKPLTNCWPTWFANPDATHAEIADQIGRSRSTVGNYIAELSDAGQLHKNGHGWEVAGTVDS